MRLFLPENIWKDKRGFPFKKPVNYLTVGYHTGQDFFTELGQTPVFAPADGELTAFNFSTSAGWWGYFEFTHEGKIYSLKILHMYRQLRSGQYKEGDILGYCGGTGLAITQKYGTSYIGPSHAEQSSDRAVPHLHVELHIGEFKHDTNTNKTLADLRIIDPVSTLERWINSQNNNNMIFYKEFGKSAVYIKGADNIYYPIIMGKHFLALFGDWSKNTINEVSSVSPKSDSYFGIFKSDNIGKYDPA